MGSLWLVCVIFLTYSCGTLRASSDDDIEFWKTLGDDTAASARSVASGDSSRRAARTPTSGQVLRLVNNEYQHNYGLVSLRTKNAWVYFCGDTWTENAGKVVCRQLGFPDGQVSVWSEDAPADALVLAQELRCSGHEMTTAECSVQQGLECPSPKVAAVKCQVEHGCPDLWTPGLGRCYRLFSKAKNLRLAASVCALNGGSLVNIETRQENHFLSDMIRNFNTGIHQWYTGGVRKLNKTYWYRLEEKISSHRHSTRLRLLRKQPRSRYMSFRLKRGSKRRPIWKRRSPYQTVRTPVADDIWFPGWPSRYNLYKEPDRYRSGKNCLTLSNQFLDPHNRWVEIDYFFWMADRCSSRRGINFVCEMPNPTLEVDTQQSQNCPTHQFRCPDGQCLNARWVCDGERDCRGGADENSCDNFYLELRNGSSPREGRLELTVAGLRGSVCDDQWDDRDAAVVCRMMGFNYGGRALRRARYGQGSGPVWLDNVNCKGHEASLSECTHRGLAVHDCHHSEDASVRCFTSPQDGAQVTPTPTTVLMADAVSTAMTTQTSDRPEDILFSLVGGIGTMEGNVAINYAGWSFRICDNGWGPEEATVICRTLGFLHGGTPLQHSFFGADDSEIILDYVECTGDEASLLLCSANIGRKNNNCTREQFAGVICFSGEDEITEPTTKRPVQSTPDPTEANDAPDQDISDIATCGLRPYSTRNLFSRRRRSIKEPFLSKRSHVQRLIELPASSKMGDTSSHKIVGGSMAPHGKFPWQLGIRELLSWLPDGSYRTIHLCGATIISEFWVLTAAHCVHHKRKDHLIIIAGDHNNREPDRGEQRFLVDKILPHSRYHNESYDYDIALIKVRAQNGHGFAFSDYVQPACLPKSATPPTEGLHCLVSGWGMDGRGRYPEVLRGTSVPLIGHRRCLDSHDPRRKGKYTRRMICAGYFDGGIDTCKGDSGGPLVCPFEGSFTVVGITSWGRGCAAANYPGVYTSVPQLLPWIHESIVEYSRRATAEAIVPQPAK